MYCYIKFLRIVCLFYLSYSMLDADNDARITLNEAEEFFENIGLDDIAIGKAFKKADKNGDSTVTLKGIYHYPLNSIAHSYFNMFSLTCFTNI